MASIRFVQIPKKKDRWQVFNGQVLLGRTRLRGGSYQLDLGRSITGGSRVQKSFQSKPELLAWLERIVRDYQAHGKEAYDLTPERRRICFSALDILKAFPDSTLVAAAKFYLEYHDPARERRTIRQLIDEFLQSKRTSGKADATIKDYAVRLSFFAKEHGEKDAHDITPQLVEKWFDDHHMAGLNRQNYRRHLTVLFNYALKRGYCVKNPAADTEKVTIKRGLPVILTTQEATKLLRTAQNTAPELVPYIAIGLFAGLRPDEIRRLEWRNVHFTRREIYVAPTASKTADRYVVISDNLMEWLACYPGHGKERKEQDAVFCSRSILERIRAEAKVPWTQDILRHSFASHYCPIHGTVETADQMGHKGMSVLFKHYRRAVSRQDAEKYWQIVPNAQADIIQLEAHLG